MKIAVIAPTAIPSRRANSIQTMKMAQALANLGHTVRVVAPTSPPAAIEPVAWEALSRHYGLELISDQPDSRPTNLDIEWLLARTSLRRYDFSWRSVSWARRWQADLLYTRLPQAAALASQTNLSVILEIHDLPKGNIGPWMFRLFLKGRGARRLVVITRSLADDLHQYFDAPGPAEIQSSFTVISPDGVDLGRYAELPLPAAARSQMQPILPERFTVGYTGHFYSGRGLDLILSLAARLSTINFLLVGGEENEVQKLTGRAKSLALENTFITGFIPNTDLPLYQAACEALLMPYQKQVAASSGGDIARYLSPMKVFEYMASGRAILSSDLSVLREVLSSENAVLLPPDDLEAWITAIRELQGDPQWRARLGDRARSDVQQYSWETRAQTILAGISIQSDSAAAPVHTVERYP